MGIGKVLILKTIFTRKIRSNKEHYVQKVGISKLRGEMIPLSSSQGHVMFVWLQNERSHSIFNLSYSSINIMGTDLLLQLNILNIDNVHKPIKQVVFSLM